MTAPILEAIDLHKRYGAQPALNGASLAVHAGEIVGLLGPNGAGKTTMLSILARVMRPDAGTVHCAAGAGPRGSVAPIGLVPQRLALYPTLTVAQNVWHFARMQGLRRREARVARARVLVETGLTERSYQRAATLSGGMQRRLNLACGIVHRPAALLLDEPTVGVDLESREQLLAGIRELRDAGAAVVYSTHYMEEAERLCDRVVLVDRGRVVAAGTVRELIAQAGGRPRMTVNAGVRATPSFTLADAFVALTGHACADDDRG